MVSRLEVDPCERLLSDLGSDTKLVARLNVSQVPVRLMVMTVATNRELVRLCAGELRAMLCLQ